MNSWDKSDSHYCVKKPDSACEKCRFVRFENNNYLCDSKNKYIIGKEDLQLAKKLVKSGTSHRKYLRQIFVSLDVTAPLYWWKEFDTYKVGTVTNSCSTMHKLCDKQFELNDFSFDQLLNTEECTDGIDVLIMIIKHLNEFRDLFLETKAKHYWYTIIQLLPESYNQKRTLTLNYEVLANIYNDRANHKLYEWRNFCKWIKSLPYSELITQED